MRRYARPARLEAYVCVASTDRVYYGWRCHWREVCHQLPTPGSFFFFFFFGGAGRGEEAAMAALHARGRQVAVAGVMVLRRTGSRDV